MVLPASTCLSSDDLRLRIPTPPHVPASTLLVEAQTRHTKTASKGAFVGFWERVIDPGKSVAGCQEAVASVAAAGLAGAGAFAGAFRAAALFLLVAFAADDVLANFRFFGREPALAAFAEGVAPARLAALFTLAHRAL